MIDKIKEEVGKHYDLRDVPQEHRDNAALSQFNCPICALRGSWRRGVHFDNEMICMRGSHERAKVWCPDSIVGYRESLAFELRNCFGDGI